MEGGCANDYVYVFGDPVNDSDLDGMGVREWARERARNVKNIGRGASNAISRNVFTCADTTFTRAAGALSLAPPFGTGGSERAWAGSAAGWLNFVVGSGVGLAASGKLGAPALAGVAGTAVSGRVPRLHCGRGRGHGVRLGSALSVPQPMNLTDLLTVTLFLVPCVHLVIRRFQDRFEAFFVHIGLFLFSGCILGFGAAGLAIWLTFPPIALAAAVSQYVYARDSRSSRSH